MSFYALEITIWHFRNNELTFIYSFFSWHYDSLEWQFDACTLLIKSLLNQEFLDKVLRKDEMSSKIKKCMLLV